MESRTDLPATIEMAGAGNGVEGLIYYCVWATFNLHLLVVGESLGFCIKYSILTHVAVILLVLYGYR